jgi:pectinesterase
MSFLRLSLCLGALALCHCAAQTRLPEPVDNGYTFESSYHKLRPHYPQLERALVILPASVHVDRDLVYKRIGTRDLQLDLFIPRRPRQTPLPAVVLVHGGGWRTGSRPLLYPLAIELAQRGYAAATVSYRLSGEALFPAAIEDVRDAVLWLQGQARRYRLDVERFALGGGSAGGQIAALVAYSGGDLGSGGSRAKVQALLNIDGLSDFTSPEALPFENDPRKKPSSAGAWLGGRYEEVPEKWRQASPIFYIDADAPPTLFLNSSQPRFHAGRDAAIARLSDLDIATRTVTYENAPHSFWLFSPWLQSTADDCARFLADVFSGALHETVVVESNPAPGIGHQNSGAGCGGGWDRPTSGHR